MIAGMKEFNSKPVEPAEDHLPLSPMFSSDSKQPTSKQRGREDDMRNSLTKWSSPRVLLRLLLNEFLFYTHATDATDRHETERAIILYLGHVYNVSRLVLKSLLIWTERSPLQPIAATPSFVWNSLVQYTLLMLLGSLYSARLFLFNTNKVTPLCSEGDHIAGQSPSEYSDRAFNPIDPPLL